MIKQVALLGSKWKPEIEPAILQMQVMLEKQGAEVILVDKTDSQDLSNFQCDMIFVLGGDGTLLSAARRLVDNPHNIPVVGVNLGKFGFLAEFEFSEMEEQLPDILAGTFMDRNRIMLRGSVWRENTKIWEFPAMNEFVISRSQYSRILELSVFVDDKYCTHYHVDGLIVSTPAGSTAHSLSAGGPVLAPSMEAFVITPVCPHTLTVRPLVVPSQMTIKINVSDHHDSVALTGDGQEFCDLKKGDQIILCQGDTKLRLVQSPKRSFFETLRTKLHWSGHLVPTKS